MLGRAELICSMPLSLPLVLCTVGLVSLAGGCCQMVQTCLGVLSRLLCVVQSVCKSSPYGAPVSEAPIPVAGACETPPTAPQWLPWPRAGPEPRTETGPSSIPSGRLRMTPRDAHDPRFPVFYQRSLLYSEGPHPPQHPCGLCGPPHHLLHLLLPLEVILNNDS